MLTIRQKAMNMLALTLQPDMGGHQNLRQQDVRELAEWIVRLAPVESWFPSLNQGPPGDFANWSWAVMDEARALLERTKETEK